MRSDGGGVDGGWSVVRAREQRGNPSHGRAKMALSWAAAARTAQAADVRPSPPLPDPRCRTLGSVTAVLGNRSACGFKCGPHTAAQVERAVSRLPWREAHRVSLRAAATRGSQRWEMHRGSCRSSSRSSVQPRVGRYLAWFKSQQLDLPAEDGLRAAAFAPCLHALHRAPLLSQTCH